MDVFVGVDIGGSHIGVGIVDSKGKILDSKEIEIDNHKLTPNDAVNIIAQNARGMVDSLSRVQPCRIVSAGVGCPGQAFNGVLVAASNLPHFKNVPLASLLSSALNGISVTLVNDADAAISAEVWGTEGIYDKFSNVAMITLGTGIGFGLILDGQLYQGSYGLVEGGHMIVSTSSNSRQCGCGQKGCVEAYSSAKNTALRLAELDAKDGHPVDPSMMTGKEAFSRYLLNDFNAVNVVEETAEHLAILCINICRVIDPQVIVFGGGLSKAGNVLIDLVNKHIKLKTWTVLPTDVKLVLSQSANAGVVGAALAAQNKFRKHQVGRSTVKHNDDIDKTLGGKESYSHWVGPLIATTSAIALAISLKQESCSTTRSFGYSNWARNVCLLGQMGLGIALMFMNK